MSVLVADTFRCVNIEFTANPGPNGVFIGDNVGSGTGTNNALVGAQAMSASTTANNNVALGYRTITSSLASVGQVAVGSLTMENTTTGSGNSMVGYQALQNNLTGNNNSGLGYQVLLANTGSDNVAVGYQAGTSIDGNQNVIVGSQALFNATSGSQNTAVGYQTLLNSVNVTGHTAVGYQAGANCTSFYNTMFGLNAGANITSGFENVAIGLNTGPQGGFGTVGFTTAVGNSAVTNGSFSIAIGNQASTGSGSSNIMIGDSAGQAASTGEGNLGIGHNVLTAPNTGMDTNGYFNTSVGHLSMYWGTGAGSKNVAHGYEALGGRYALTSNSTSVGFQSAHSVNGDNIVSIGNQSQWIDTRGESNSSTGHQAHHGPSVLDEYVNTFTGQTFLVFDNNVSYAVNVTGNTGVLYPGMAIVATATTSPQYLDSIYTGDPNSAAQQWVLSNTGPPGFMVGSWQATIRGPLALFNGDCNGTVLTVTAVISGAIYIGMRITGTGGVTKAVPWGAYVTDFTAGAYGGVGTYVISVVAPNTGAIVMSGSMVGMANTVNTATNAAQIITLAPFTLTVAYNDIFPVSGTFTVVTAHFSASFVDDTMLVWSIADGTLEVGQLITATGISSRVTIAVSAGGGTGTYRLSESVGPIGNFPGVSVQAANVVTYTGKTYPNDFTGCTASGTFPVVQGALVQSFVENSDSFNTADGYQALLRNNGQKNTAVGALSLSGNTAGAYNTALGYSAGSKLITGYNNTIIGYNAQPTAVDAVNEFTLGNSSVAVLRSQQTAITALSDKRDKADISPLTIGLDFINLLKPVSFIWNPRDGNANIGKHDLGFIAQELQEAQNFANAEVPGLVYAANPDKLEAAYGKLLPILVKAIQDLSARVTFLETK